MVPDALGAVVAAAVIEGGLAGRGDLTNLPRQTTTCPLQARIAETEAEIGTDLLGQLSGAEQAEVRQLQPQVARLQVGGCVGGVVGSERLLGYCSSALLGIRCPARSLFPHLPLPAVPAYSAPAHTPPSTRACLPTYLPACPSPQEELEARKAEQLEVEASVAALDAELAENLREQRRDLQDRLAAASSSVDAATLEARRRELQQVGGRMDGRLGWAGGPGRVCSVHARC